GCRYCQAHTAHTAKNLGIGEEKLADLWQWETSPHFDAAERAALTLALNAASVPNTATDEHIEELRRHFDDDQILGLVATISLFGFLNRWNDTLATDLEDTPAAFAREVLASGGWVADKHRPDVG
ncbi:MAG: carboxymuconolactone decarboxylase family protein, partial [Actinomycetota bacterium]